MMWVCPGRVRAQSPHPAIPMPTHVPLFPFAQYWWFYIVFTLAVLVVLAVV